MIQKIYSCEPDKMTEITPFPQPPKLLTTREIFCQLKAPYFASCQRCAGCLNLLFPGAGLFGACCCLGDCCQKGACEVSCAGLAMVATAPVLFGWVVSLIVGVRMLVL